jgi:hypothetical protein
VACPGHLTYSESCLNSSPKLRTEILISTFSTVTVGGGRLAPVGVPGLLLAGGVNFYGNQHGFSADQVVQYEVVLASGKIVYATKSLNADLFWALKGGSSNFGIVTRFDMTTISSKKVFAGIITVANDCMPQYLAVCPSFGLNDSLTNNFSRR